MIHIFTPIGRPIWAGLCFLFLIMLAATAATAETRIVPAGGSIDAILSIAQPGDTVLVSCGVYPEQGLVLPEGVNLRGETGQPGCVTIAGDGSAPILSCIEVTAAARIDGITFRGQQTATQQPVRGGGLHLENASPTIAGCRFENLRAVYGGGVYARTGSQPTFRETVFRGNHALAVGGAVALVDSCGAVLETCLLYDNRADATGGAINASRKVQVTLDRCTVADNQGPSEVFPSGAAPALAFWADAVDTLHASILAEAVLWSGDDATFLRAGCSNIYTDQEGIPLVPISPDNISADPLFCVNLAGDHHYNLDEASPCTPEASPGCDGMGALPVGCAMSPVGDPPPDAADLPAVTRLREAYPNPFNPVTTIRYDLSRDGHVTLEVFDLAGRLVDRLVNEVLTAGSHEAVWRGTNRDGRNRAAGVYFLRLKTVEARDTQRVTLVK
jgi:hypothetical protein